jgi:hypothetical protein
MVGQDVWYGNVMYADDAYNNQTFSFIGTEETLKNLDAYIGRVPELVYAELELYAEKILSESKQEVPWDTTHLLQSGTVEPYNEGDFVGFQIGYDAISSHTKFANIASPGFSGSLSLTTDYNYGLKQHEDLTLHHPKPGRKAKYLEDPFNRIKGDVVPGIVSTIDWYFGAGAPSMIGMMASKRASLGNLGGRFV